MKILIIGDGALGTRTAREADKRGHEVFQTSRKNTELIHFELVDDFSISDLPRADWTVIAAGISGYKECEQNPLSRKINVDRTIELCRALITRGSKVLYPSSTAVFDGQTPFPPENTPTKPDTAYGRHKAEVEKFLQQFPEQAAILRLTKLLARDTPLISGWLENLGAGKEITPFRDLNIAPVHFKDAARTCLQIMETDATGIFHCSGPQEISYHEFALELCRQGGFDQHNISPISCKEILDYCPAHCALETCETEKKLNLEFPAPEEVVSKLLRPRCLLCKSTDIQSFSEFNDFHGLTSDCKPWPRAGEFLLCKECGHAQKKLSAEWLRDINDIYSGYEMYSLSDGSEPLIFDKNGKGTPRSGVLLEQLILELDLPEQGSALDMGCGNGSLLQQFHLRRPGWDLYGQEQSAQREEILHLPGVKGFFCGGLESIDRKFDLITMTYVIEHLTDPLGMLRQLRELLNPEGQIVIHTSSFETNPFDLMVCDHCSHFTPATLGRLAQQAGLEITVRTDPWLAKEIGFCARKGKTPLPSAMIAENQSSLKDALDWLKQLRTQAESASEKGKTGIFGTAVAGTWLAASLEGKADFFVDEDPSKQGRKHMGLPIIGPGDVPAGAALLMGFSNELGKKIAERLLLDYPEINFIIPNK